jgi:hypothetical protein
MIWLFSGDGAFSLANEALLLDKKKKRMPKPFFNVMI